MVSNRRSAELHREYRRACTPGAEGGYGKFLQVKVERVFSQLFCQDSVFAYPLAGQGEPRAFDPREAPEEPE